MKKYHLLFLFAAFIAVTSSAQKLDNLVELKQKSENPLFHHLDKAPRTPAFRMRRLLGLGQFGRERR